MRKCICYKSLTLRTLTKVKIYFYKCFSVLPALWFFPENLTSCTSYPKAFDQKHSPTRHVKIQKRENHFLSKASSCKNSLPLNLKTHSEIKPFKYNHGTKRYSKGPFFQNTWIGKETWNFSSVRLAWSFFAEVILVQATNETTLLQQLRYLLMKVSLKKKTAQAHTQLDQKEQQLQTNIEFHIEKKDFTLGLSLMTFKTAVHLKLFKATGWFRHEKGRNRLL